MKLTKFCLVGLFLGAFMLTFSGSATASEGDFWGGFDPAGEFLLGESWGEGDPFMPDPPSLGPWWEYTEWWNIWWYNHEFDYCRRKTVGLDVWVVPMFPGELSWIDITINWSTDEWSLTPPEGIDPTLQPPVPGWPTAILYNPENYIERLWTFDSLYNWHFDIDILPGMEPFHFVWDGTLPAPYNPEWVSIDIRGVNVWILNNAVLPPPWVLPEWTLPEYRSFLFHDCVLCEDLEAPSAVAAVDPPFSMLGPYFRVSGGTVNLNGSGSTDDCGIVLYEWNLVHSNSTNSKSATGVTPTVTGLATGIYDVTLKVTDCAGKSDDSDTLQILSCFISTLAGSL